MSDDPDALVKKLEEAAEVLDFHARNKKLPPGDNDYSDSASYMREAAAFIRSQASEGLEAERDELRELERNSVELLVAQNALVNEVWDILGRHPYREGGQNLVGRIRELYERALAAESSLSTKTAEVERLREALERTRNAILSPINKNAITDTVWMPVEGATYSIETLVDFIDAARARSTGEAV